MDQPDGTTPIAAPARKKARHCEDCDVDRRHIEPESKERARKLFHKVRARVLAMMPQSLRDMYGQICFARFGKTWYLALVLEPYDMPPGEAWNQWKEMFETCQENEALDEMKHALYWYGTPVENGCYGFVAHKDLVVYRQGIYRGYFKPYEAATIKSKENKKLTKKEQDKLIAIKEVEEDLRKDPGDRKRGVTNVLEKWESKFQNGDDSQSVSSPIPEGEDLKDSDDEDDIEEEEEEKEEESIHQNYARRKSYHDSNRLHRVKTPSSTTKLPKEPAGARGGGKTFIDANDQSPLKIHHPTPLITEKRLRLSLSDIGFVFSDYRTTLQHLRAEARRLFQKEKEAVLSKLTEQHCQSFGQMGFYKEHAVLIVSPYSVPPGPVRTMWMDKLIEMDTCEKLAHVPYLVYQYDARKSGDDPRKLDHCFTLVPPRELVTYEEGERRGFGQIPPEIQRRLLMDGENSLAPPDKHLLDVLREKEMDAGKEPSQRRHAFQKFSEAYDLLTLSSSGD